MMKKILNKKYVIYYIVAIVVLYSICNMLYHVNKTNKLVKEFQPQTKNFLNLIIEKKHEELYKIFGTQSGMTESLFIQELEKINKRYGNAQSYRYKGASISSESRFGDMTGFYIKYDLLFSDSDKPYHVIFDIEINKRINIPIWNKISSFNIERDFGEDSFYINLSRHKDKRIDVKPGPRVTH